MDGRLPAHLTCLKILVGGRYGKPLYSHYSLPGVMDLAKSLSSIKIGRYIINIILSNSNDALFSIRGVFIQLYKNN